MQRDHLGGRHHGQPVADVLQLAHVTREGKLLQPRQRRVGNALGLHAQLPGALLQKVAREHGHVLVPLAQRGQAQADHVEAVEQVLAEATFLDALLQVLVRGGNHAHMGLDGRVAAHPVELAVRQHAQKTRLQIKRHVADFIEEQRAALGLLEAAAPLRLRTGEGAALVAEEFALQQVLGNGGGVDGHKGAIGHGRMLVQRARHQFLARAGFAGDEHRDLALRQPPDGAEHVLHGGRLAQHFGGCGLALFGDFFALAFFDRAADQLHRLGQVKGLGQVFERAALKGRHRAVEVGVRRHDDDGQAGLQLAHLLQQLQARASGHADVAHQDLGALAGGVARSDIGQCVQHFARVREAARGQVLAGQRLFQDEADRGVVIYYPDRLHMFFLPSLWLRVRDRRASARTCSISFWTSKKILNRF